MPAARAHDQDDLQRRLRGHLPALDGLRGLAIALVLLHHALQFAPRAPTRVSWSLVIAGRMGWVGVDVFFVLSGFLITGILLESRGRRGWLTSFYARRVLRIFPLYYAYIAVAVCLGGLAAGTDAGQDWLITRQGWFWGYLQNWVFMREGWHETPIATGHTWSLAVEEQFYLVWPAVIGLLGTGRALRCAAIVAVATALAFRCWLVATGSGWEAPYVATVGRMDALLIGAMVAMRLRRGTPIATLGRVARIGLACGAPALVIAMYAFHERGAWMMSVGLTVLGVVAACALISAVLDDGSPWQRLLAWAPLRRLGQRSYALYLLHYQVLVVGAGIWTSRFADHVAPSVAWQLLFAGVAIALSWLLAELSWVCFERPILSLKRFVPMPRASAAPPIAGASEQPSAVAG